MATNVDSDSGSPVLEAPPPVNAPYLWYLYCIVEASSEVRQLLRTAQLDGPFDGESLAAIDEDGLIGVVSQVPADIFQEASLNELASDLRRLAPFAVQHEAVVSSLLPVTPAIIPMAFGTVYRDSLGVAALLRARKDDFLHRLESLRDKHEWGVKVVRDATRLRQAVESSSARIREHDARAARSGPGRAYLLGKRREQLVAAEAEQLLAQTVGIIFQRLATVSADARREELPDRAPEGAVSLVLKAAFLVHTAGLEAFSRTLDELRRTFASNGVDLEVSGPWAPYSFVGQDRR